MLAAWLGAAMPSTSLAGQAALHLAIGDPVRKDREAPVVLDAITDTATGDVIGPGEMARRLAGTGLLFIGEIHTSQACHDAQLQAIKALREAGREVLIGLEMFPYTEQASLDRWNAGRVTEEAFVESARWYDHWGYHWNYYREIFRYARQNRIRLYAINSPRNLVKSVRAGGFERLTPGEAARLPPRLAPDSAEHQRMFRAFFAADDVLHMNEADQAGLYRAQTLWDATMGWNALQALRQHGGKDAIMVVLMGAGHVTFGLGAERQVAPYYDGRISSLVPVNVVDDEGNPAKSVRASYANFVWGLPEETDTAYPSLGVSLLGAMGPAGKATGQEAARIIQVAPGSVAERSGLRVGDILLSLDDTPIGTPGSLRQLMAGYRWGDVAQARIRRDGSEIEVVIRFRRSGSG